MVMSPGLLWLSGCEGSAERGVGYKLSRISKIGQKWGGRKMQSKERGR